MFHTCCERLPEVLLLFHVALVLHVHLVQGPFHARMFPWLCHQGGYRSLKVLLQHRERRFELDRNDHFGQSAIEDQPVSRCKFCFN